MNYLGKTLIIFGLVVTLVGVGIILLPKAPYLSNLGRLPGDIRIEWGNFTLGLRNNNMDNLEAQVCVEC